MQGGISVTIEEIQARKQKLEADVRDIIAAFQEETHCAVVEVEVSKMDCTVLNAGPRVVITEVRATVVVP